MERRWTDFLSAERSPETDCLKPTVVPIEGQIEELP